VNPGPISVTASGSDPAAFNDYHSTTFRVYWATTGWFNSDGGGSVAGKCVPYDPSIAPYDTCRFGIEIVGELHGPAGDWYGGYGGPGQVFSFGYVDDRSEPWGCNGGCPVVFTPGVYTMTASASGFVSGPNGFIGSINGSAISTVTFDNATPEPNSFGLSTTGALAWGIWMWMRKTRTD
jgi:hypothetical protein